MLASAIKNPLLIFLAATFGISFFLGIPFLVAVTPLVAGFPPLVATYLPRLVVVFGPALGALFVVYRLSGRGGVRGLLGHLRPNTRHWRWWLGLPFAGICVTGGAFLLAGASPVALRQALSQGWALLAAHFLLQLTLIGVGEELGWRGWLLPHLLRRWTRLKATGLLALVWGLWHTPLLLSGLQIALPFVGLVVALSFLFTYLWHRAGGNVFVMALAHASVNAPIFFLDHTSYTGALETNLLLPAWRWIAMLYSLLALLLLALRWRWWGSPPDPHDRVVGTP